MFTVNECAAEGTLSILINDQPVDMLIDSGASCNVVTESKFKQLKSKSHIKLQRPVKRVYPLGSTTPLCVKGVFTAGVKANESSETITATIQVIEEAQICV